MKIDVRISLLAAVAILGMVGLGTVGCEKASRGGLSVDPAQATLSPSSNTVLFSATISSNSALALPLAWSVANPAMGSIARTAGTTALYVGNGTPGMNIIGVKTADGSEGFAQIDMVLPGDPAQSTITLSPTTPTLSGSNGTVYFTVSVSGGTNSAALPLKWYVSNSSLGIVYDAAGYSAVYVRAPVNGINTVTVRASDGAQAIAVVTQQ